MVLKIVAIVTILMVLAGMSMAAIMGLSNACVAK
jgi:hypothetical protein